MKFEKKEVGHIEYRLPAPVEALRLMEKLNVMTRGSGEGDANLGLMADVIEAAGPFVSGVKVKLDDVEFKDWEMLKAYPGAMNLLVEFAGQFLSMGQLDEKKRG